MTALDDIQFNARRYPNAVAIADLRQGREWTYREAELLVSRLCAGLVARGVGEGDRVAVLSANRGELPLLHFACARLGALLVPLNYRLAGSEIARILANADPQLQLAESEWVGGSALQMDSLDEFLVDCAHCVGLQTALRSAEEPNLILYTSGTTGAPKGVMLSERNIQATAANFSRLGHVERHSVFLCDSPMFHIIGLVTSIRTALMLGATVLVSDRFEPGRTLARLADPALGVSHYFCVPQMAAALRAHPDYSPRKLAGLSALFCGGAPMSSEEVGVWLDEGVLLVDGFGMTETGTVFGMPLDAELIRSHPGSCGLATPQVHTRIADDRGQLCPSGTPGEIQVRADSVTLGYFRNAEANAAAFTTDGYFRTGDIGVVDDDGFHRIVDRKKDIYISGGENVYPGEVEVVVLRHELVRECAIVGVSDARWGEVGHLFVVPTESAAFDADRLLADLGQELARYKLPKYVTVVEQLPRTGSGKVLKARLKAEHEAMPPHTARPS